MDSISPHAPLSTSPLSSSSDGQVMSERDEDGCL